MANKLEHTLLKDILLWIASNQRNLEENIVNNVQEDLFDLLGKLQTVYHTADELTLERLLKLGERVELIEKDLFLFLWPITKGGYYLPVMTLKYDFTQGIAEARYRVALFHLHEGKPRASGYRFETQEGVGRHNYCHAQLITSFDKDRYNLPCERWLPVDQPAFCLDATEPISLLMNLLVSLYGFDRVTDLLATRFGSELKPFIENTWWSKRNPAVVGHR